MYTRVIQVSRLQSLRFMFSFVQHRQLHQMHCNTYFEKGSYALLTKPKKSLIIFSLGNTPGWVPWIDMGLKLVLSFKKWENLSKFYWIPLIMYLWMQGFFCWKIPKLKGLINRSPKFKLLLWFWFFESKL